MLTSVNSLIFFVKVIYCSPNKEVLKMNKKKNIIICLAVLICLALTGCTSSVAINSLVPATANVSGYKTIAVRSTIDDSNLKVPFYSTSIGFKAEVPSKYYVNLKFESNLDYNVGYSVAKAVTDEIYSDLDTGIYTLVTPKATDALVEVGKNFGTVKKTLEDKGIDAILTTKITSMTFEEYIVCETDTYVSKDADGKDFYRKRFYLVQSYSASLLYTLTDVENNTVVVNDTIANNAQQKTLVGRTKNANGDFEKVEFTAYKASYLLKRLVCDMSSEIATSLVPQYKREYFSLMANKPKIDALKPAYDFVDSGDYELALRLFLAQYNKNGHLASGYNACIMYYALGDYDNAFSLASDLYFNSGSTKAIELYKRMKSVKERTDKALDQITSSEKSGGAKNTELVGF